MFKEKAGNQTRDHAIVTTRDGTKDHAILGKCIDLFCFFTLVGFGEHLSSSFLLSCQMVLFLLNRTQAVNLEVIVIRGSAPKVRANYMFPVESTCGFKAKFSFHMLLMLIYYAVFKVKTHNIILGTPAHNT